MSNDNLQKMALALSDVEAELKRRREAETMGEPSEEFLDAFDDLEDIEDYFDDEVVDNDDE